MKTQEKIRSEVREKYSEIAKQSKDQNAQSCCGAAGCGEVDYTVFSEDYSSLEGYLENADLGLGCGLPTEFARIKEGDVVVDLGSGAGNDCFVARAQAGPSGKVIGVDMTEAMIEQARKNADTLGLNNVEFRQGEIEKLPIGGCTTNVVVSNCVMNLLPDKEPGFKETFRILKPGGHFSISDIVIKGEMPDALRKEAELYAGCVSGAISKEMYLKIISDVGFVNVKIDKEKSIKLPKELWLKYLSEAEYENMMEKGLGIYSINVYAEKPNTNSCC